MRIDDIRGKIYDSFLYKRFAYNSDGFISLMKFLEKENIIDDFCEECNFDKNYFINDLKDNQEISIEKFFGHSEYSFSFARSKLGDDFWFNKIFYNRNFNKIRHKIL